MPLSAEEEAVQVAGAFNQLGHLACGHPLDEARRSLGDSRLKDVLRESANVCLQLIRRTERGPHPEAFPRPAEAQAALSRLQALLPSLDWDDADSVAHLRASARQALEALGLQLLE